ncbi:MAG: hypothetical protein ACYCOU_01375 [Sulfobacillus sp.]
MAKMLDDLREHLDDIERADPRSFEFLQGVLIAREEGDKKPLSGKQFKWLQDLHERYCCRPSRAKSWPTEPEEDI